MEIYATSIDYNPKADESILFFKQVQNKVHWAAHKHTAAEIVFQRADSEKDNMGLTSWDGDQIRRTDTEVAKNYLDIAEVQALNHEPMYMKDWLETIDDYLKMTRREILTTKEHVNKQSKKPMLNTISTKRNRIHYYLLWKKILLKVLQN